jgi:probable HAF family extracellular repeat protein
MMPWKTRLVISRPVLPAVLLLAACSEAPTAPSEPRSNPKPQADLCSPACFLAYKITYIGSLGGLQSIANDINDAGVVVGTSETNSGKRHAFRYVNGAMQDLGTLPGDDESYALGINNSGEIVGVSQGSSGTHAFLWHAFVQPGVPKMLDLGAVTGLPPGDVHATGINNSGAIVGFACGTPCINVVDVAFRRTAAGMFALPGLPGEGTAASAVNDNGLAVGGRFQSLPAGHAAKWPAAGGLVDIGDPGQNSYANGVNLNGDIVGFSTFFYDGGADGTLHGAFWPGKGGFIYDLGPGIASDVSNKGRIVGRTYDLKPYTMLDPLGNRTMLPLFGDGSGGEPHAVNTCGNIAGEVMMPGYHRAVIWTKVLCDQ